MRAWTIAQTGPIHAGSTPLTLTSMPVPEPGRGQVLIQVECCGVCHTELDEIEGRTPPSHLPMIPGHQVIGRITKTGAEASQWQAGQRVGLAWIFSACGHCSWCLKGQENLCNDFIATGRDRHGGYADYVVADANYCVAIPEQLTSTSAAPLLCGGAIGYRSLSLAGISDGEVLGLTGFGASNHLVLRMARVLYPASPIYVFARSQQQQQFALQLGATWAGDTCARPPKPCRSIIDTTPVWLPIMAALEVLQPGGRLVINAIRKLSIDNDQLAALDYPRHLWLEKEIKSVANVTRRDVQECLLLTARHELLPKVSCYEFVEANQAILELVAGDNLGAKILIINP